MLDREHFREHKTLTRLHKLKPELDENVKLIGRETALAARKYNWPKTKAKYEFDKAVAKVRLDLFRRYNCHPFKSQIASIIQLPLWISVSLGLRNMALGLPSCNPDYQLVQGQLCVEGVAWIPNLTDMDHSYILPVTLVLTNLFMTEILPLVRKQELKFSQKIVTYVYRGFCLFIVPLAAFAPADIVLYWTVSNSLSIAQNLALLTPGFRRLCGIPKLESELQHPFRELAKNVKNKFSINRIKK
ncbi:cytochrome c oxidase assembly protein COX18, mitochondrial-like isoform X2 [Artemia franciscana]|uniref:cytochrome c oxidase assembly protein COX18, mitochondrial-like isoform X2 n=1 Tax=Artemia franciscana TaxID=6661 RepID=UPI0032DB50E5